MGKKPNWLFMVYMVAGDNDTLDSLAVQDLLEMERGVAKNPYVQVFVQVHRKWPENPQRYIIAKPNVKSASPTPVSPEKSSPAPDEKNQWSEPSSPTPERVNMGKQETLENFLAEALKRVPDAEHYCLVLWGHSAGLGFGREHGNKLTLGELREALGKFQEHHGERLDLLGGNTCTLAYAEAIYELQEQCAVHGRLGSLRAVRRMAISRDPQPSCSTKAR